MVFNHFYLVQFSHLALNSWRCRAVTLGGWGLDQCGAETETNTKVFTQHTHPHLTAKNPSMQGVGFPCIQTTVAACLRWTDGTLNDIKTNKSHWIKFQLDFLNGKVNIRCRSKPEHKAGNAHTCVPAECKIMFICTPSVRIINHALTRCPDTTAAEYSTTAPAFVASCGHAPPPQNSFYNTNHSSCAVWEYS